MREMRGEERKGERRSMKIILEYYDTRYTAESINPKANEYNAGELKSLFSKLLVCAGFPARVIEFEDGDEFDLGQYELVGPDEVVIKQEYLNKLEDNMRATQKPEEA